MTAQTRPTPWPRAAFAHMTAIPTRWADNDIYGHINNVVYYSYFDTAVNGYLIGAGALDPQTSPVIGLVVETQCQFFAPSAFPQTLNVGLRAARIGATSVVYELGVFPDEAESAAAQGRFVHVYVDRESRRPTPLPDALRRAVLALGAA